jgi:hypothetical protein
MANLALHRHRARAPPSASTSRCVRVRVLAQRAVYLNNDYIDVELDLNSTNKDAKSTPGEHLKAALWAQIVLVSLGSGGRL